ncbi:LysR substrate-binding domain-containing protein [Pseudalkalibacillus decolorationis]|uniref:LysR substrate-binding domain-containing protein n=1 Tax=Pseudalkalibacillus decolorationis TaxID=163879 RepID=UPI0021488EBC|nr:LysR substrate-binding domain-containing protein [Pseudalkalibacillus decolorationis]
MELRHVRYFITLAEELHFGRAANRLHIAQPPLSRQIQKLEEEIDVRLFDRTKRNVKLTNAGKVFLEKAYQILDQVEQARVITQMTSKGEHGGLTVGFTGTSEGVIKIIRKFKEEYPLVGLILHKMGKADQIRALHEKRIDVGFVASPVISDQLHVRSLGEIPFMAVLPETHPLTSKKSPLYIHDLAEESFVMTPKTAGVDYYNTFIKICHQSGFTPKITIHAHDVQTIIALVSSGIGVSLVNSKFPLKGAVYRKLEDVTITMERAVVWRRGEKSDVLQNFLNVLDSINLPENE